MNSTHDRSLGKHRSCGCAEIHDSMNRVLTVISEDIGVRSFEYGMGRMGYPCMSTVFAVFERTIDSEMIRWSGDGCVLEEKKLSNAVDAITVAPDDVKDVTFHRAQGFPRTLEPLEPSFEKVTNDDGRLKTLSGIVCLLLETARNTSCLVQHLVRQPEYTASSRQLSRRAHTESLRVIDELSWAGP